MKTRGCLALALALAATTTAARGQARDLYNREAGVPPQCYTKTEGRFNPCYVCHQDARPGAWNQLGDGDQQLQYNFSDVALKNHWRNLFVDRHEEVAGTSDEEIDRWVARDNYADMLEGLPPDSDEALGLPVVRGLGGGASAFDRDGVARDGSRWVAINYKPLPSTFWPTNGAFDDVFVRLPLPFASQDGVTYSRDAYLANLTIVECALKRLPGVSSPPIDEAAIGLDLDGDGSLGTARFVRRRDRYVGAAAEEPVVDSNFPVGTEFLHTLRYLAVTDGGQVVPAPRMKEVRYMVKRYAMSRTQLERYYAEERFEKDTGVVPVYPGSGRHGLGNKQGWKVSALIEDTDGRLRKTSYEENLFCMGCHSGIGVIVDSTFSFVRKLDGEPGWGYVDLSTQHDAPTLGEQVGEFALYLKRVGGGSEFRSNAEMQQRWFEGGALRQEAMEGLTLDRLIVPSPARARRLDKAYYRIVKSGLFVQGRDPTVQPVPTVYEHIEGSESLLKEKIDYQLQLDWSGSIEPKVARTE